MWEDRVRSVNPSGPGPVLVIERVSRGKTGTEGRSSAILCRNDSYVGANDSVNNSFDREYNESRETYVYEFYLS